MSARHVSHFLWPTESNNFRAKLLHPTSISIIIGFFTLFQLSLTQVARHYPQILGYASQIPIEEIIKQTNSKRVEAGLQPVQYDEQLSKAAAAKASDMLARDYWAHVSPQGTQPWYFITAENYPYRYAGENLARDFADPTSIVKAWMDSPTHRENLLNSRYQDIGVAVVDGKLDGRETTLVVQMFGTRLAAAPATKPDTSSTAVAIVPPAQAVNDSGALVPTTVPSATAIPSLQANPFTITKYISLFLLGVFSTILIIDIYQVYRRRIVRWTSRSLAHLAFMLFLLITITYLNIGQIK